MKNIFLCGKMGSGKDFIGKILTDEFGYAKVSLAAPLKRGAEAILGRPIDKRVDRKFLQEIGMAGRRVDENFWIKLGLEEVILANRSGKPVVITDMRFKNEAHHLTKVGGVVVKVVCSPSVRKSRIVLRDGGLDESTMSDLTETGIDEIIHDVLIDNTDKEYDELVEELKAIVTE